MEQNQNKRKPLRRAPSEILSDLGKMPPVAIDLEESVLGHLISHIGTCNKILTWLPTEAFYKDIHLSVYKAIKTLWGSREPIDLLTVVQQLKKDGELDNIGGAYALAIIANKKVGNTPEYHARIIYEKYLAREVIRTGSDYVSKAYDDTCDVLILLEDFERDVRGLSTFKKEALVIRGKDIADNMIKEFVFMEENPDVPLPTTVYYTGDAQFDKRVTLGRDRILLMSGATSHGKSRYIRSIMFKLLKNYGEEIAIDWVTLEDPAVEVLRGYLSTNVLIKTKDIEDRTYNKALNQAMIALTYEFKKFDIEFTEKITSIAHITDHFRMFCEKRPEKFNILIIDNILSTSDHANFRGRSVEADDYIMGEILACRQLTHGLIIPIHHYNSGQADKGNLISGYRPTLTDLKGSEAYRRVPNQVLLCLNPALQKDLLNEYPPDVQDVLKYLFIVDPGKNRRDENNEDMVIRYLMSLNFDLFEEII